MLLSFLLLQLNLYLIHISGKLTMVSNLCTKSSSTMMDTDIFKLFYLANDDIGITRGTASYSGYYLCGTLYTAIWRKSQAEVKEI